VCLSQNRPTPFPGAGCRRRRLNQGLVVALDSLPVLDRACFCVNFLVSGCMLCLVCKLFIISTSAIDYLGRFVSEMIYYVSSGTINLTKPKPGAMELDQSVSGVTRPYLRLCSRRRTAATSPSLHSLEEQ